MWASISWSIFPARWFQIYYPSDTSWWWCPYLEETTSRSCECAAHSWFGYYGGSLDMQLWQPDNSFWGRPFRPMLPTIEFQTQQLSHPFFAVCIPQQKVQEDTGPSVSDVGNCLKGPCSSVHWRHSLSRQLLQVCSAWDEGGHGVSCKNGAADTIVSQCGPQEQDQSMSWVPCGCTYDSVRRLHYRRPLEIHPVRRCSVARATSFSPSWIWTLDVREGC